MHTAPVKMKAAFLVVKIVIKQIPCAGHLQRQRGAVTAACQKHLPTYIAHIGAARVSRGDSASKTLYSEMFRPSADCL
tara:strand:- start:110739 stop:110972 length:234 start_codon:yes stop_codon:yes gene_type:complete